MTALVIVLGVFAWGCCVGAIVSFFAAARYARELHTRVVRLEQQRIEIVRHYMFTAEQDAQIAAMNQRIFEELFTDDPYVEDDDEPVTRH